MASTSTNKLPMLMDRPLGRIRRLDQTSSTATIDPGTGTNGVLLASCVQNDGALIESVFLIQRVDNDRTIINFYLSTSEVSLGVTSSGGQADSYFFTRALMPINAKIGMSEPVELPLLLAPVPHANGASNVMREPQFRGLRLEKGWALWAAADGPGPHPSAPNVGITGGLY